MSEPSTPTISIITATYNAAAVLPRLIESLIAQTDQDILGAKNHRIIFTTHDAPFHSL